LLAGAGLGLATSGLEYLSLRGRFDHRRGLEPSARERFAASLRGVDPGTVGVVHVAHSTHLICVGGARLLTDPWFYDPAFGALSHEVMPAVVPSEIGKLDVILVTHDHADHADLRAMDEMDKRAIVLVATSDLAARVRARGFADVAVLAPWEERTIGDVVVGAVPALHDIYEIGYVVRRASAPSPSVYFAGDTRLHPDLPAIAERFKPDLAILPVDGTRISGAALHVMTPEDAAIAARLLGSKIVMPSHADAFFSDPVAGHVLASMVSRAKEQFQKVMTVESMGDRVRLPLPGELVRL
jgi:L-ascorbate metabolism protein UlaG (beta-lactamase superfamily)